MLRIYKALIADRPGYCDRFIVCLWGDLGEVADPGQVAALSWDDVVSRLSREPVLKLADRRVLMVPPRLESHQVLLDSAALDLPVGTTARVFCYKVESQERAALPYSVDLDVAFHPPGLLERMPHSDTHP
jgi:hypothetical protein